MAQHEHSKTNRLLAFAKTRGSAVWISVLFALAANTAVSIYNVSELIGNDIFVDHSRQVLAQLNLLLSDLKDAETGQRGFLLTEDESYLQPYLLSRTNAPARLQTLKSLSANNTNRLARLAEIEQAITDKFSELEFSIEVRKHVGCEAARSIVMLGYGKTKMDDIRALANTMIQLESEVLVERARVARAKHTATLISAGVGGLLTLGMTGIAFFLIRNELARRRQAEQSLRASEADLRSRAEELAKAQRETSETLALLESFLANAPIGFAFLDRNLRFVRVNQHLAIADGLSADAHIGRLPSELESSFAKALVDDLRYVLHARKTILDRQIIDSSTQHGQDLVWQASYFPIVTSEGGTLGVGVMMRDVTQRLQAERALRDSQARFRDLAESMPQFVWVTRPDGFAEYFNQRWYQHTGLSYDQSIGFQWTTALHPEDRPLAEERWKHSTETGQPYDLEFRLRGTNGAYRWFLGRALPRVDEHGRTINWFGTCTDIHDRKRIEAQLQQSMERFRLLAESIPQMVWTSDRDGNVDYFNQRWIDFTGITAANAQNRSWSEVVHPDDRDRAISRWLDSLRGGIHYEAEARFFRTVDATYRWCLVIAAPICDAAGKMVQWIGTLTDIDDHKRQSEVLERLVSGSALKRFPASTSR